MNELGRGLRFAYRSMTRTPGPMIAAILSLAIGIGANTALFSVVNGLQLKPLPYPDSDRLGLIWLHSPGLGILQDWPSPGQFLDLKAQNRSFDDMAIGHGSAQTLTGGAESARVRQLRVFHDGAGKAGEVSAAHSSRGQTRHLVEQGDDGPVSYTEWEREGRLQSAERAVPAHTS